MNARQDKGERHNVHHLDVHHARRATATSPRDRFLLIAVATGMSAEQAWTGFDFLRQVGMTETAALTFATERALEGWPPEVTH
jgi:hypothetical protein